jgi:hypothetical protein
MGISQKKEKNDKGEAIDQIDVERKKKSNFDQIEEQAQLKPQTISLQTFIQSDAKRQA